MQSLLLLSGFVATVTIAGLVVRFRHELDFSISLNALKHRRALLGFIFGVSLSLLLAAVWYFGWFVYQYELSLFSSCLFGGVLAGLFVVAIIPDKKGRWRMVHRGSAYLAVACMPVFLLSIMPLQSSIVAVVNFFVIAAQLAMIYLLVFVKAAYQYFLPLQCVYLADFFLVLLLMTYTG